MRQIYCLGNWKMTMNKADILTYKSQFKVSSSNHLFLGIAPQMIHIPLLINESVSFNIGGQNCSFYNQGAYTGETSVESLKEFGISFCLVGHSERRQYFNETNENCLKKIQKLASHRIRAIYCIGETLEQRQQNLTEHILTTQLEILKNLNEQEKNFLVIAYEPVWAIGTGKAATAHEANETHQLIRNILQKNALNPTQISILYGGSVNAANIDSLISQEHIDGVLVGGASTKSEEFQKIANSCIK